MKLKKLLKDIPIHQVKGSKEIEITGICLNSKVVAPGNLFIAKKGLNDDGTAYIQEAIEGGAVAILTDIYNPMLKNIVQLIHPYASSIEGKLAAQYYRDPSQELFTVGITGTNGKTTTSFLIKHLLDDIEGPCGLIGTIEYIIGQHRYRATLTTPDVCSNQKMLREMVIQGCRSAVMEVTSHALDQGRVANIDYDVAIFTNLTLDHLDYHLTMENYAATKSRLFTAMEPGKKKNSPFTRTAVVNADDPRHKFLLKECPTEVLTYGLLPGADLQAMDIKLTSTGTRFKLNYKGATLDCSLPLIGRHNVYNFLAAACVGLVRKVSIETIVKRMATVPSVPGRLEPVPNELGIEIYVDFAHTDDALANIFDCLQEIKTKRLIAVFGCGGDRDRNKRPLMAQVCEKNCDLSIVTSDNPRTEDPAAICAQVIQGFKNKDGYLVEIDRKKAIAKAIDLAEPGDIVLIAGKGHETSQIFAHQTLEFDDCKVARQACEKRRQACVIS